MKFIYKHCTYDTDTLSDKMKSNPEIVKAINLAKSKFDAISEKTLLQKTEDPEKKNKEKGHK